MILSISGIVAAMNGKPTARNMLDELAYFAPAPASLKAWQAQTGDKPTGAII